MPSTRASTTALEPRPQGSILQPTPSQLSSSSSSTMGWSSGCQLSTAAGTSPLLVPTAHQPWPYLILLVKRAWSAILFTTSRDHIMSLYIKLLLLSANGLSPRAGCLGKAVWCAVGTSSGLVPAAVDSWQPLDHPIVELLLLLS